MKNVVLITVDSLRADHSGWLGDSHLTPNLDRIANDSVCFTKAISPGPRTPSSIPVIFTGEDLSIPVNNNRDYESRVARIKSHMATNKTLAEKFKDKGYSTIGFTANPWTSSENGFDSGFDVFREVGKDGGDIQSAFSGTVLEKPARFVDLWVNKDTWFSQWRTFYTELISTIEETSEPFFLWVFLLDTHNPYLVPREDREESSLFSMYESTIKANSLNRESGSETAFDSSQERGIIKKLEKSYRDCVRSVDKFVGEIKSDLPDGTNLIFHSDHGEAFGEHGTFGHEPVLYTENIHVPLIIHGPDYTGTINKPVSAKRIPELAINCSSDNNKAISDSEWADQVVFSRNENATSIAAMDRDWKFIQNTAKENELYHFTSDPDERQNVIHENPEVRDYLKGEIKSYRERLSKADPINDSEADKQMKEHLQDLGYL